MEKQDEILLQVEHVSKTFPLEKKKWLQAVKDVNFTMKRGECLAVVGESGSGKSTLARMISGILPVSEGKLLFDGRDVTHIGYEAWRQLRRDMQFVFQDPNDAFSPRMKIGVFMCEPYVNYRICNKKEAWEKSINLLKKVELGENIMEKYPHELSGGELQRVVIARAMALQPRLMICDEITSALDVSIQEQIIGLLRQLQQEEQVAILFISHDLALVQSLANRMIVMRHGSIVEEIKSQDLLDAKHPYTKALLESVFLVK